MHICAWQSADSRVTTDHCRVTLRWVFRKSFLIAWNVQKRCLTVSRRSRDLRPLSRDRSATFFKFYSNCLKRPKTLFDSRPTVAWPQPLSRDRSATFFKIFPNRMKRPKNVVWHSSDGRVTSDHCRVTVQRLFSKFSQIAWNVQKRCLTVGRRSRDLRPLSRDRSATFFKIFPNCLKRPKNVVWQSADGRVTSDHCRVTVQRLFQNFPKSLETSKNVVWQSADGRVTSDHCRVTVRRLFSKKFLISLKRPKNVVWQSSDGRVTSDHCRVTVQRLFFKIFLNCLKRPKNVVWQSADGRVTSDHCRVTVQRLFSKFSQIAWNVQKTLFDSRPTVAWPPTTVAWLFSDFFQKNF